ncbi:MAG: hypothetical protein A3E87_04920 [Gammaproteobacteria bacterium RIFCSPHIGHO2_12_FULL_35_23]|nr:MAG: hypothetical protein A3E87_04920 [Gammaproteobacteria bacterium RIFCSPHIGHO2_12_FULL_35_23]
MKQELFDIVTIPFTKLFRKANKINVSLYEKANLIYPIKKGKKDFKLFCPNNMTLWRAKTYFTKEPHTLTWIDSFSENDILFDIGANVGLYTIYAAERGIKVFAFEPESQNYALLNRNIYLNSLQDKVNALNIAVGEKEEFGALNIKDFTIGGALNNFGDNLDCNYERFSPKFKQAVIAHTIDYLIQQYKLPVPNHIKIDVDGLEPSVITGALQTLKNLALKSVLIELNTKLTDHMNVLDTMINNGFEVAQKDCVIDRSDTEFSHFYNYIFKRLI